MNDMSKIWYFKNQKDKCVQIYYQSNKYRGLQLLLKVLFFFSQNITEVEKLSKSKLVTNQISKRLILCHFSLNWSTENTINSNFVL